MTDSNREQELREQMEVRIVALLMGETSPFETAELQEAMKKDPALAAFHDEMRRTIGLVSEASTPATGPATVEQPTLSPERREALISTFKQKKVLKFPRIPALTFIQRRWLVPATLAASILIFIGISLLLPASSRSMKFSATLPRTSPSAWTSSDNSWSAGEYSMQLPSGGSPTVEPPSTPVPEAPVERVAESTKASGAVAGAKIFMPGQSLASMDEKSSTESLSAAPKDTLALAPLPLRLPLPTLKGTPDDLPSGPHIEPMGTISVAHLDDAKKSKDLPVPPPAGIPPVLANSDFVANGSKSFAANFAESPAQKAQSFGRGYGGGGYGGAARADDGGAASYGLAINQPTPSVGAKQVDSLAASTEKAAGMASERISQNRGAITLNGFADLSSTDSTRQAGRTLQSRQLWSSDSSGEIVKNNQSTTDGSVLSLGGEIKARDFYDDSLKQEAAKTAKAEAEWYYKQDRNELSSTPQNQALFAGRMLHNAVPTDGIAATPPPASGPANARFAARPTPIPGLAAASPAPAASVPPPVTTLDSLEGKMLKAPAKPQSLARGRGDTLGKQVPAEEPAAVAIPAAPPLELGFAYQTTELAKSPKAAQTPAPVVAGQKRAEDWDADEFRFVGTNVIVPFSSTVQPQPDESRHIALYRESQVQAGLDAKPAATAGDLVKERLASELDKSLESNGRQVLLYDAEPAARKKLAPSVPPTPQPEITTRDNAFSTFSLNVSDVSFKLAAASLENGEMPDPASVRVEEFVNAFNYRDPSPRSPARLAFAWDRAQYPFAHNRDVLRFSVQTAARGREAQKPLNLVLLMDCSGSMERPDRVAIMQQALRVLAQQLKPQDRVSVIAFSRTARLLVDGMRGGNSKDFLDKVLGMNPQGGTNLEDAMGLAYATAKRHFIAHGVNRVILLTDGAANLGNIDPDTLKARVIAQRGRGIALDCFGIGWEGYNDDLLEVLSRNGDGRYGFLNRPEDAAPEFANQLAGALNVAASDVKTQVEFNPQRVQSWRQIGYAKHQLTKEQFRDNKVDAAEIAASESGNALYVIQSNPKGTGPIGVVRVRFKVPDTGEYLEQEWTIPYQAKVPAMDQASSAIRLASTAAAFGEYLSGSPYASGVKLVDLQKYLAGVPELYAPDPRPQQLAAMLRQAQAAGGR